MAGPDEDKKDTNKPAPPHKYKYGTETGRGWWPAGTGPTDEELDVMMGRKRKPPPLLEELGRALLAGLKRLGCAPLAEGVALRTLGIVLVVIVSATSLLIVALFVWITADFWNALFELGAGGILMLWFLGWCINDWLDKNLSPRGRRRR